MKNDVNRLPTALAKMPPVTHRLNMSERAVLTRLATGGQMTNAVNAPTAAASLHGAALSNPPPQGLTLLPVKGQVISPPSTRPAVDSTRSPVLATRPNDV